MKGKDAKADILKAVREVPLISSAASQLLQMTSDPEHALSDIVEIIKVDATLTASVLKVVNSAAFARRSSIDSIDRAVSLLGEDMIVGIAMSDAASHLFESKLEGYGGESGDLWRHDLRTAIASKKIARYTKNNVSGDVAFTCGLLHDLGKAVLSEYLKNTYKEILAEIGKGKFSDYSSAEQSIVGIDHPEVGFELAKYWNLPEPLLSAILYHHHPANAGPDLKPLVYTVHLGDTIAMMGGKGTGADTLFYKLDSGYTDYIDLTDNDLALVVLEVDMEFAKIQESLAAEGEN